MKAKTNRSSVCRAAQLLFAALAIQLTAAPLGTVFTYQGRLMEGTNAHTGNAEFQATLWDADAGGTAVATNATGSVIVGVTNGLFVLPLDFGTNFSGEARWLQLEVRTSIGPFATLSPRQELTPAPHALYATSAGTAATASIVPAANVTGILSDARLSGNVALLNADQSFTGANTFNNGGNAFTGNGSALTMLNADNLASGTVPDLRLSPNIAKLNGNQTFTGNNIFSGNNSFTGDGSGLTSLNANNLNAATTVPGACLSGLYSGLVTFNNAGNSFQGSFNGTGAGLTSLNANNLASGTVGDTRLSANVALLTGNQTFNGVKIFGVAPSFSSAGTPFTVANPMLVVNLNADQLDGSHAAAFAPASASANYIQNQNAGAQSGNLWISGTARAGYFAGDGSVLTGLNANNLVSGIVADARLSSNIPKLNATQTFTSDNTLQNGVFTSEGTSGSGMRFGSSDLYSSGVQTIISFASGALLWNNTTSQVILTNKTGFTYVHFAGTKREDLSGSFTNLSGYVVPNGSTVLATLNSNGEHLVVDVACRDLGWGFVHLYCFYDNSYLRCNYYYQCQ